MGFLWLVRVGVFSAIALFSVIELGVAAGYIAKLASFDLLRPTYASFAVAVSVISLITVVPMLVIDFLRGGAITSWVLVELAVTGVLWILWLASAALSANASGGQTVDCSAVDDFYGEYGSVNGQLCRMYQAIEAFGFLNWILVVVYFGLLLTYALIGHFRGNSPWRGSVRDTNFTVKNEPASVPMTQPGTVYSYAPVPVQQVPQA